MSRRSLPGPASDGAVVGRRPPLCPTLRGEERPDLARRSVPGTVAVAARAIDHGLPGVPG
ncbi:hypothetical protein [Nocardia sp. CC227C]|uniref:hypothetical protein n=1 Tax=Nocardia sp. CC227C TaxID=3044562 RepID=UPI00278C070D|nr:hypothetical protein [Nocardia sp. CC227C]